MGLREGADCRAGLTQGAVYSGAPENLQARHQAGAQAGAHRGVRGCAQGGVHQVQDQPQEGEEARGEEVVLRSFRGVRPRIIKSTLTSLPLTVAENMNIVVSCNTSL